MTRPMFLLVLLECMCMCCNSSRIKRLENRVSRIESSAVFHNDLEDIDKKMEALNSSVTQCLDPERVIPDIAASEESLTQDVGRVELALADEKARWRREASAIKIDIADNRHAIGDIKTDVIGTGHAIVNVKKSIGSFESTVRQVSDDFVHKVNKVEMSVKAYVDDSITTYVDSSVDELKTYVDNSIKALKDDIIKALRDSVTSCPQTTTPAPAQTTTLATTQAPAQTTTLATTQAPAQTTIPTTTSPVKLPSCLELHHNGERQSGVYTIYPLPSNQPVQVYCDMDTDGGGWTVFQRRQDGSVNFYRTWAEYASGFGNVSGEFWLGNDLISSLTSRGPHELRIDIKDYDNHSVYANYGTFQLSPSAAKYRLEVGEFSGDAGDSLRRHSGMAFTTRDRDNDGYSGVNCAEFLRGAWWYSHCAYSDLNALYGQGHGHRGVWWWHWKGSYAPLMWTEMKLRATPKA